MALRLFHLPLACMGLACASVAAQAQLLTFPPVITAGSAFSINVAGAGAGQITIVGPTQVLRQDVGAQRVVAFPVGALHNAGHYIVLFTSGASAVETRTLDVVPAREATALSFLAKPSRLPVAVHDGISGAAYLFDRYGNLVTLPAPVTFTLSTTSDAAQVRSVTSHGGVAWTQMDSSSKEGSARFIARTADVTSMRIIQQVPGEPCSLHVNAHPAAKAVALVTDPVRDCKGNAVPDGTIVTFTETYGGRQTTADVPLKHGVAQIEVPSEPGARITVASGVVLGNEVRL